MAKIVNLTGEEVVALTAQYMSESDVAIVQKALDYATKAHISQVRQSGEPYIIHPIQVAGILADLHLDVVTVACGFLHDVVEDTEITLDEIEAEFGKDVRDIVDGVTKLGKVEYKSHEEQLAENHRKMLMAMSKDIRVILVKLADRLHNMRTLKHLRKDKQERISRETMEIYAPLAHRLGISRIKWELEDLSFRYLNEIEFYKISHMMNEKRREREALVDEIVKKIKDYTEEQGLYGDVYGRPKHIYSIYRKMRDKKKRFDQIYDLIAIRCIMEPLAMFTLWLVIFMNCGVQCQGVSKIILLRLKLTVTNLFTRLFTDQKDQSKFKSVPKKCTKSLNTGLLLTGLTKKGLKARLTVKNKLSA